MKAWLVVLPSDDNEAEIVFAETEEEARRLACRFSVMLDDELRSELLIQHMPLLDNKQEIVPVDYLSIGGWCECGGCSRKIHSTTLEDEGGFVDGDGIVWCSDCWEARDAASK